jgi:hypothetical protein
MNFLWERNDQKLINDWEKLIVSVVRNRVTFMGNSDLPLEDFRHFYLNDMNGDAVPIEWTDLSKEVVRTTPVIPGGTATAERTFSLVNVIKIYRRSVLSPSTLEALVRIKYNGPTDVRHINISLCSRVVQRPQHR